MSATPAGSKVAAIKGTAVPGPLIPLNIFDAPSQRVYLASAFLLLESYKLYELIASFYTSSTTWTLLGSFLLFNLFFVSVASRLRVPRLDFSKGKWISLFVLLGVVDWTICGGWRTLLRLTQWVPLLGSLIKVVFEGWNNAFDRELSFSERRIRLKDLIEPKQHIFGQHTIHILPHSTAALSPSESTSSLPSCFCLDSSNPKAEITIPILFNNTEPHYLSYSITPFEEEAESTVYNITIPRSSLSSVGGSGDSRVLTRQREDRIDLELEDADDQRRQNDDDSMAVVRRGSREVGPKSSTRSSQSSPHLNAATTSVNSGLRFELPIKKVGRIRLERVLDKNRFDARLSRREVIVVECPSTNFERQTLHNKERKADVNLQHQCPGEEAIFDVGVHGLAPLELMYSRRLDIDTKMTNQRAGDKPQRETFTISHISGNISTFNPLSFEDDRAERLATILSAKTSDSSFDWAVARDVILPVTVEFLKPGRYRYELDQVKDACGNAFRVDSSLSKWHREVQVHARREASFIGCDGRNPINLLQGGPEKEIYIQVTSHDPEESPFEVQVGYQGVEQEWQRNITLKGQRTALAIDKPGTYTLESVKGRYCMGEVGTPWLCTAQEIPPPTSSIEFDAIQDQCAGSVGVKALAILSGTPPFKLKYSIRPSGKASSTHIRNIDRTREEIEFRPTADGEITYTFLSLSDANYKDIKLDGPTFTQNLHPIAKAAFAANKINQVLHSCQGNSSIAEINLEGVGPFELSYAVRTSGGELAYTRQIQGITDTVYPLKVEVPARIAEKGGHLTVTLTSIKDAKGCERPLTTSDLFIDVKRSKPSIAFVDPRETLMLEGGEARLSIRLAGEGPWKVRYRREDSGENPIYANINKAEAALIVDKAGTYLLEDVSDQHCPGHVVDIKSVHRVSIRPRPTAAFEIDGHSQIDDAASTLTRQAVCVGTIDSVNVRLQGHFPVQISYQHRLPSKEIVKDNFISAQNTTAIELFTGLAGLHSYELVGVGDAIYTERKLSPNAGFVKVMQEVFALPTVVFANSLQVASKGSTAKPSSLCVGNSLFQQSSDDNTKSKLSMILTGKAPFSVDIDIKDGRDTIRKSLSRRGISSHQMELDISADEFVFDKTGKWSVEVTRVQDSNGCEQIIDRSPIVTKLGDEINLRQAAKASSWQVEVVETANISAVDSRKDHCVGETIEYGLQGTSPWTITYDFEGTQSQASARTSTFARVAEKPGELQIKRIAHQQNKCQNNVEDQAGMIKMIHALPRVHVKEGKHYIEDLREGNQAEIVFKFQGVPPFSFSIQRTQAVDRFQEPTVLESFTIKDHPDSTYHLYTAEEGTWSVTWLRDHYCEISLNPLKAKKGL